MLRTNLHLWLGFTSLPAVAARKREDFSGDFSDSANFPCTPAITIGEIGTGEAAGHELCGQNTYSRQLTPPELTGDSILGNA